MFLHQPSHWSDHSSCYRVLIHSSRTRRLGESHTASEIRKVRSYRNCCFHPRCVESIARIAVGRRQISLVRLSNCSSITTLRAFERCFHWNSDLQARQRNLATKNHGAAKYCRWSVVFNVSWCGILHARLLCQ